MLPPPPPPPPPLPTDAASRQSICWTWRIPRTLIFISMPSGINYLWNIIRIVSAASSLLYLKYLSSDDGGFGICAQDNLSLIMPISLSFGQKYPFGYPGRKQLASIKRRKPIKSLPWKSARFIHNLSNGIFVTSDFWSMISTAHSISQFPRSPSSSFLCILAPPTVPPVVLKY